ncbi:hypothetical protein NC99_45710 [Sunxiuqinia dokdonensis]|uniref:Uncharacterized protein n=1 Tax=Sunxiuqinia dokdonensis TaxID=1409788 RepID=A0A0L8V2G5_9BACT|nr:hypothetical protein NC99_45710 [Sunxiuqinia dokdonensis]
MATQSLQLAKFLKKLDILSLPLAKSFLNLSAVYLNKE